MASASASLTRQVVRAYHDAWTGPNVARAGDYIAQDFKTRASVGSYDSRTEYLAGLSNFRTNFVTRVDLLSELLSMAIVEAPLVAVVVSAGGHGVPSGGH